MCLCHSLGLSLFYFRFTESFFKFCINLESPCQSQKLQLYSDRIALNLKICLGRTDILIILNLPVH